MNISCHLNNCHRRHNEPCIQNILSLVYASYTSVYLCSLQHYYFRSSLTIIHEQLKHALQWRHNGRDGVSNHQPHGRLLNRLIKRRPVKTSKLRVTGLCVRSSPLTGEFPAQMVSNAQNISMWWRHHVSENISRQRTDEEDETNVVFNTMHADYLSPLDDRTYASSVNKMDRSVYVRDVTSNW